VCAGRGTVAALGDKVRAQGKGVVRGKLDALAASLHAASNSQPAVLGRRIPSERPEPNGK
jgi:hypothetical protein